MTPPRPDFRRIRRYDTPLNPTRAEARHSSTGPPAPVDGRSPTLPIMRPNPRRRPRVSVTFPTILSAIALATLSTAEPALASHGVSGDTLPAETPRRVTQFRGDASHTGVLETRGLKSYGGILWRTPLPGPIRSTPAVADGVVYVGSAGGFLHTLDRDTGRELWRYRTGSPAHGSPAVYGDLVYETDMDGTLHAVDRASGIGVWKSETGPAVPWRWGHESGDVYASSPTLADVDGEVRVFWGSADGTLRSADPLTGAEFWRVDTDGRIRSTPAVAEGKVVVGSADGRVYCVDAATGAVLWSHAIRGHDFFSGDFGFDRTTIQSSPAIVDGRVHVGTRDGRFYTLDLSTGERLWDFDHDVSWSNGSAAVSDGRVFSSTSDGRWVHAMDATTGVELWRLTTRSIVWTSPVVVGETVYYTAFDRVVRALDVTDGSVRWQAALPSQMHGSPTVDDGTLFVGAEDGGVYALRDGGGQPFHRAVFWDSTTANTGWYAGDEDLTRGLAQAGYEELDEAALVAWLEARIQDHAPSSVVFAQSSLSPAVRDGGEHSPFRRYLDAGGTVVWASLPPDIRRVDPQTGTPDPLSKIGWNRPSALLGISVAGAIFDRTGADSTDEGVRMGLPVRWLSQWNVPAQAGLTPLAVDENGAYAAFRESFGGAPGTGFVRIWGSSTALADLTPFLMAAEWRPMAF